MDSDFFSTLASLPELGRTIDAVDNGQGRDGVVLISHALWQQLFAGSADVLSKSLQLNGRPYRIIGVMPLGFNYPHNTDLDLGDTHIAVTDLWTPLALSPQQKADRDFFSGAYALARMKPGVSVKQSQAEMTTIMARLDLLHQPMLRGSKALVKPFRETLVGSAHPLMWLLLGSVFSVLLIACGNTANLLLARGASRTQEFAMRATLGAGRQRLIQQMLTESALFGLAGGMSGIGFAYLLLHILLKLDPGNIPRLQEASLDTRVLLFTVAVTLLTSLVTGILPALASTDIDLVKSLKSGGDRGSVGTRSRLRSSLIVAEVTMVVILLTGASLLLRSYVNIEAVQTGFSASAVSMKLDLSAEYSQPLQRVTFVRRLIDELSAIPGVQAAGAVDRLPLSRGEAVSTFWVEGYANQKGQMVESGRATPNYFAAMGTPLIEGRSFSEDDTTGRREVAMINQAFAKKYFAGRDPIGRWVRTDQPDKPSHDYKGGKTIVGVIADVRRSSVEKSPQPEMFQPLWQEDIMSGSYIAIRSALPPNGVASTAGSILHKMDPGLAFTDVHTMGEIVSEAYARRRFQTTLLTIFAAMALLLALVGLYGLLAYSVKQRTAEMGVRIALGASRLRVMQIVVRQGFQLVVAGLAFGLAGAIALSRVLASSLYGVRTTDPLTFTLVPVLMLLAALAACLIPGWRAASIDPVRSLRSD